MPKEVFYSFHYEADGWRAAKIRHIGTVAGNPPASDNGWELVKGGGPPAIERWIRNEMDGRSCVVVLIGAGTAGRKWIDHEIDKGWRDGIGVLGIYVHNITDRDERTSSKGRNPFYDHIINGVSLGSVVKTYDPIGRDSKSVYEYISTNLASWIDEAIKTRRLY